MFYHKSLTHLGSNVSALIAIAPSALASLSHSELVVLYIGAGLAGNALQLAHWQFIRERYTKKAHKTASCWFQVRFFRPAAPLYFPSSLPRLHTPSGSGVTLWRALASRRSDYY